MLFDAFPLPLNVVLRLLGVLNGVKLQDVSGVGVDSREGAARLCADDVRACVRARVSAAEEDRDSGVVGTMDHPKREMRREVDDGNGVDAANSGGGLEDEAWDGNGGSGTDDTVCTKD